jgi:hypothetical protein
MASIVNSPPTDPPEACMRSLIVALIVAPIAMAACSFKSEAAEPCMIGDAALCLADPNCHWDGSRRGCYPGPAPFKDACAAHEAKAICDVSTLGCQWSEASKKCEAKSH